MLTLVNKSRSVTVTEGKAPAAAGIPLIWPESKLMVNPGGSPEALHEYSPIPPLPVIVNAYGVPTIAGGNAEVEMVSPCARSSCFARRGEKARVYGVVKLTRWFF